MTRVSRARALATVAQRVKRPRGGAGACRVGRAPSRRAGLSQGAEQGLDEEADDDAEQDEGECRGLQGREVLGDGGVQGEAAEAGNVEDFLHRDGTADQPHDGRKELRKDTGQGAAQRVPGDVVGCEAVGVQVRAHGSL